MDASHLPLLWLCSVCAVAVCAIGVLSLLAAFGMPGTLVVALVFVEMAVPTVPALREPPSAPEHGRRGH